MLKFSILTTQLTTGLIYLPDGIVWPLEEQVKQKKICNQNEEQVPNEASGPQDSLTAKVDEELPVLQDVQDARNIGPRHLNFIIHLSTLQVLQVPLNPQQKAPAYTVALVPLFLLSKLTFHLKCELDWQMSLNVSVGHITSFLEQIM